MLQFPLINGETSITGIIGWPLLYTLSPQIHNLFFAQNALNWCYIPLPLTPESVPAAIAGLRTLPIKGFSVTMPFKETVIATIDDLDPIARMIGSVNTVYKKDGLLVGANTDALGFARALAEESDFDPARHAAVVVGAGGGARAVCFALAELACRKITIIGRNLARADRIRNDLLGFYKGIDIATMSEPLEEALEPPCLIINATPIGMEETIDKTPLPNHFFTKDHIAFDLIYKPLKTRFLYEAERGRATIVNGSGMLLHQAAAASKIWTGIEPDIEPVRSELDLKKAVQV